MGSVFDIKIDGKTYSLKPMNLDILNRIESYMKSLEPPLKEEAAGIAVIAEVDPALAEKLFDKALQRRKSIPPVEVLEYASHDVHGFARATFYMLQRDYPETNFTFEKILEAFAEIAEGNREEFDRIVQERNEASGVVKPENPTDAAQTPQN